jgi:hypothetical protein
MTYFTRASQLVVVFLKRAREKKGMAISIHLHFKKVILV